MPIYLPPSLRYFDPRVCLISAWIDHIPFGYDLVETLKPGMLVELGTYQGLSYFTFCQSVADHELETLCYAVDTWEGDKHTRAYDERIYQEVNHYNRNHFPGFSYLMRMPFRDALAHFPDGSIDLLHIDGCHTYEAVAEDFGDWFGKVRPGGIVLMHDTVARSADFGVWKFWNEMSPAYDSFLFHHGFGLGVIRKPGGPERREPLLEMLFDRDPAMVKRLRAFYVHAARYIVDRLKENCPKPMLKGRGETKKAEESH